MTIQEHISRIKARGFKYKEDKEVAIQPKTYSIVDPKEEIVTDAKRGA